MIASRPTTTLDAQDNIAWHLHAMAARQPHTLAVVVPEGRNRAGRVRYSHLTYRQLDDESDRIAAGLAASGVRPQTRAAVMVRPGLDFFALVFALFKAGVAPVMIDPGMGIKSIGGCMRQAEPELFFGIPRALLARQVLGWGSGSVRRVIAVTQGRNWPGVETLDTLRRFGQRAIDEGTIPTPVFRPTVADGLAAILFTSGSTGSPKGAVYTHAIFQSQVEMFRSLYAIEPGETDLCTFPLFALFAPALGMTAIVPEMDPTRPAQRGSRQALSGHRRFRPHQHVRLSRPAAARGPGGAAQGRKVATLKRVVTAGAPAAPRVLETFAGLLERPAQIFTPYGATEALPVASIGSNEILEDTRFQTDRGAGVCVGQPVEGMDVRIIRVSDEAIPEWSGELELSPGSIGEIAVAGPVVTREYFRRPEATALAKIADPHRNRFFHRMGDLGYRDEQGRLWFCGRKSHRIVLHDVTLYTVCCERVFDVHPEVARSALVGVRRDGVMVPVLCVEPDVPLGRADQARLRRELLSRGEQFAHTARIATILFHRSFPVDIRHNSKIFREQLAAWAARKLP